MNKFLAKKIRRIVTFAPLVIAALTPIAARAQIDLAPTYTAPLSAMPWSSSAVTGTFYTGGTEPYEDQAWYCVFGFAYGFSATYNGGKPYIMVARVYNGSDNNANTGGLVVFNSDLDNQAVTNPLTPLQTPVGLASIGGKIYAAFPASNTITQVNPNGTNGRSIGQGLGSVHGLTVDPKTGHLYATEYNQNTILDIDVNANTVRTLMTIQDINGLQITGATGLSTDGTSIFVSVYTDTDGEHVEQFPIPSTAGKVVKSVNDFGSIYGARGIALGIGGTSGYVYVVCRHGSVFQIDRTTKNISLLGNRYAGGTNSGFAGVDPIKGALLLTGGRLLRVTPPANQSLQYTIPTVAAASLASGKTMQGTVYLAVPAPVDFIVTLTPTSNITLSAKTVTIKAGTTSATFQITGGTVTASATATIATSIALPIGAVTQSVHFTVTPH